MQIFILTYTSDDGESFTPSLVHGYSNDRQMMEIKAKELNQQLTGELERYEVAEVKHTLF